MVHSKEFLCSLISFKNFRSLRRFTKLIKTMFKIKQLTNDQLRSALLRYGVVIGPRISRRSRKSYQKQLRDLQKFNKTRPKRVLNENTVSEESSSEESSSEESSSEESSSEEFSDDYVIISSENELILPDNPMQSNNSDLAEENDFEVRDILEAFLFVCLVSAIIAFFVYF